MIPSSLIRRTGRSLVTSSVDSATLMSHTHTHRHCESGDACWPPNVVSQTETQSDTATEGLSTLGEIRHKVLPLDALERAARHVHDSSSGASNHSHQAFTDAFEEPSGALLLRSCTQPQPFSRNY